LVGKFTAASLGILYLSHMRWADWQSTVAPRVKCDVVVTSRFAMTPRTNSDNRNYRLVVPSVWLRL